MKIDWKFVLSVVGIATSIFLITHIVSVLIYLAFVYPPVGAIFFYLAQICFFSFLGYVFVVNILRDRR